MPWTALRPATLPRWQLRNGIDPQLVWAHATTFEHFGVRERHWILPFLVELEVGKTVDDLVDELSYGCLWRGEVNHQYAGLGTRYCTARLSSRYVRRVLAGSLGTMIRRFELQLPLLPGRMLAHRPRAANAAFAAPVSTSDVLLGVIDDGCPFANAKLLDAQGAPRVLALWDQNAADAQCGQLPYGRAWSRTDLAALVSSLTSGSITDESACYEQLEFTPLRRRVSHGAFVADQLAGTRSLGQRFSRDPDRVPAWEPSGDLASRADLVFVQLAEDLVQDSSSAALPSRLLDGLRFIVARSSPKTQRIVVNISDGSSRGTHDGESIIDRAMSDLVREVAASGQRSLHIVVPAGNSFAEARHARIDALPASKEREVRMILPPGNESPTQVVVRIPARTTDLSIALVPPHSTKAYTVSLGEGFGWYEDGRYLWGAVLPQPINGESGEALLCFAPTLSFTETAQRQQVAAPSGVWTIRVSSSKGLGAPVHLHVCRCQTNPGAQPRARQARFIDVDSGYAPSGYLGPEADDPQPPSSPIRRRGTLNGLGAGNTGQGIVVVGGSESRAGWPADIASAGPAASGGRVGPEIAAVIDASTALPGLTGAGVLTGVHTRMRGTSFAAPQVARVLANTGALPNTAFGVKDPLRTGTGTMEPE